MTSRRNLWTKALKNNQFEQKKINILPNKKNCNFESDEFQKRSDSNKNSILVLGIDPSLRGTGLAILEFNHVCYSQKTDRPCSANLIFSTVVKNPTKFCFTTCLINIFQKVQNILEEYDIFTAAVEQPIFVQNPRTAQILGSARSASILPIALKGIEISEYPPLRIKQSIVGFGRASKEQVAKMVANILNISKKISHDESDAIAIALCHAIKSNIWKI